MESTDPAVLLPLVKVERRYILKVVDAVGGATTSMAREKALPSDVATPGGHAR